MSRFTRTRGRKITSIAAAVFLVAVASAAAYFLLTFNFSGEGSSTFGSSGAPIAEKLTITPPSGLTPTSGFLPVTMSIEVAENLTLEPGAMLSVSATATPESCAPYITFRELPESTADHLSKEGLKAKWALFAGSPKLVEGLEVGMTNSSGSQAQCEGAPYTLHASVVGKGH